MTRAVPGLAPVGVAAMMMSTVVSVLLVGNHPDRIAYIFVGLWVLALSLVGALVASRRPKNPIGWLFLLSAAFVSFSSLAQALVERSLTSGTVLAPAAWLTLWLAVPGFGIFVWVFLLFQPATCSHPGGYGSCAQLSWAWCSWFSNSLFDPDRSTVSQPSTIPSELSRLDRCSTSSGTWAKVS